MDIMISAFERANQKGCFEFVERITESDHQKKCRIKCNSCKAVFETWQIDEIRRGRKNEIVCPECGMSSDGSEVFVKSSKSHELLEYYSAGHSMKETADRFGVTVAQVNYLAKRYGVSNGKNLLDYSKKHNEELRRESEDRIEKILTDSGFAYIGGYTDKGGRVSVKCEMCGFVFDRTVSYIRQNRLSCPACIKSEKERHQAEKEKAAQLERIRKAQERERIRKENSLLPKVRSYEKTHDAFLDRTGTCCICGKEYTVREYVESAGLKKASDGGVCSIECRQEKARRIKRSHRTPSNHRHRAKMHGCEYEPGITLRKLVMRDGLRCALCGELCDWNDHSWSKYSGPKHPTIDHIVPISKGGPHTWANVQVACAMCNSLKSDNVQGECVKGGA